MEYNVTNIKYLVKVLRNKKDSSFWMKDKALKNYYSNIGLVDKDDETSKHVLMPYPMFKSLTKKYIYDEVVSSSKTSL